MTPLAKPTDIRAVIFDLGRVLVDIDNQFLVEKLFKGFEADNLQELGRKTMSDPAMIAFNTGQMHPEEFHRRMCKHFQLEADFDTFKKLWCDIFIPMNGIEALVDTVSKHAAVGLLSDTDPIHWNFIRNRWPWVGRIPNPTLSYEVGVMKPHADIYLAAAKNVNTNPQQCLFIDDLQVNVDGARAVGMQATRFETVDALARMLENMNLLKTQD